MVGCLILLSIVKGSSFKREKRMSHCSLYCTSINVKLLGLLDELDWPRECATLQKNLALGDAKHRRQVRDLFADVRQVRQKYIGLHFDLPPLT